MLRLRRRSALAALAALTFGASSCTLLFDTSGLSASAANAPEDASSGADEDVALDNVAPPTSDATVDVSSDGRDLSAFLSPSADDGSIVIAREADFNLVALDPTVELTAQITVGEGPSKTNKGVGSLTITVSDETTINWRAGSNPIVHSLKVDVDTTRQDGVGYIVDRAQFVANNKPILATSAGALVDLRVDYQIWSQVDCPGCIDQLVLGIAEPTACGENTPGLWPGETVKDMVFTLTAPTAKGRYAIRSAFNQRYDCTDAMNFTNLSPIVIATLIVN